MWSSDKPTLRDRHLDIACRKSTPNALDDTTGQELGDVNQLLAQHFAQPVPPPPHLSWMAVQDLILQAPAPAAPLPWYRTLFQPGQLAMASATAAIAITLFAFVPVYRTSVPALEGTVYARGGDQATALPTSEGLAPVVTGKRRVIYLESRPTSGGPASQRTVVASTPEGQLEALGRLPGGGSSDDPELAAVASQQMLRPYLKMIETDDISYARMQEEVRALNQQSGTDVRYFLNTRETEIEERMTALELFRRTIGGDGFLPKTTIRVEKQLIFISDEQLASDEHLPRELLLLMEKAAAAQAAADQKSAGPDSP